MPAVRCAPGGPPRSPRTHRPRSCWPRWRAGSLSPGWRLRCRAPAGAATIRAAPPSRASILTSNASPQCASEPPLPMCRLTRGERRSSSGSVRSSERAGYVPRDCRLSARFLPGVRTIRSLRAETSRQAREWSRHPHRLDQAVRIERPGRAHTRQPGGVQAFAEVPACCDEGTVARRTATQTRKDLRGSAGPRRCRREVRPHFRSVGAVADAQHAGRMRRQAHRGSACGRRSGRCGTRPLYL